MRNVWMTLHTNKSFGTWVMRIGLLLAMAISAYKMPLAVTFLFAFAYCSDDVMGALERRDRA